MPHCRFLPVVLVLTACTEAPLPDVDAPGDLRISDVQGRAAESPLAGEIVHLQGIVSGDFQDDDADDTRNLGGFFLQDTNPDDVPATSDGIFVFDREVAGPDVNPGDVVVVDGLVAEHFGETQVVARQVQVIGAATPVTTPLALPADRVSQNSDGEFIADLEAYEGMLVRLDGTLYVQDLYGLERFGEVVLSTHAREYQFTSLQRPDAAAYAAYREALAVRRLLLDDGRAEQNASPVAYLDAHGSRAPRIGDAVNGLTGVLRYSRGSGPHGVEGWRLFPVETPRFDVRNPRPGVPDVGGDLVVASFNVLNYFSTADDAGPRCGPQGSDGCRGADSAAEFARQRARIASAVQQTGAHVVGLMELENNASASVDDLLQALNALSPGWAAVNTGIIGTDAIRVALIYRAEAVQPVGDFALLDSIVDPRFDDSRNRPALAQTFETPAGGRFTVAVNHLKSKGSPCDADGDPNRSDGQGNCNLARTRAAEALADWLLADPTGSGDDDVIIIGDLNAYQQEDPLRALEAGGFARLPGESMDMPAYSYVHDGQSGALDHALASPSLVPQVTGVAEWHINADEAPVYDYNLDRGRDPSLFDVDVPWRSSDHDPVLVGLSPDP